MLTMKQGIISNKYIHHFSYQFHIPATEEKLDFLTVFENYHTPTSGFLITFLGTVVQRWSCSPLCF